MAFDINTLLSAKEIFGIDIGYINTENSSQMVWDRFKWVSTPCHFIETIYNIHLKIRILLKYDK